MHQTLLLNGQQYTNGYLHNKRNPIVCREQFPMWNTIFHWSRLEWVYVLAKGRFVSWSNATNTRLVVGAVQLSHVGIWSCAINNATIVQLVAKNALGRCLCHLSTSSVQPLGWNWGHPCTWFYHSGVLIERAARFPPQPQTFSFGRDVLPVLIVGDLWTLHHNSFGQIQFWRHIYLHKSC